MASTYGIAVDLLEKGIPLKTLLGMERNPIISYLWHVTGNFQLGISLNYVLVSVVLTISLWYLFRKTESKNGVSLYTLIASGTANCFFFLGFLNNFLYLVRREGLNDKELNLIYIVISSIFFAIFLLFKKESKPIET